MGRCTAMAYTNDPNELVIRCELDAGHKGNHASKKDLAAVEARGKLQSVFDEAAANITRFVDSIKQIYAPLAPPRNLPHDPALRKDRRKWGGK